MPDQSTATLLPSAHVSLFVNDEGVRANAEALGNDWRYARVDIDVTKGDITNAIEALSKARQSPDLVIVETPTTEDVLTDQLETLAEYCDENTAAIVIGPVNDVYLYRTLIGMGVSDYLVPPIEEDAFADMIARTLVERIGTAGSQLVAYVGAKGGVGTSALTRASAQTVVNKLDQKTFLLDAAGGWSYLSVAVGTEPVTTLRSAVRAARDGDEDGFRRIVYNVDERLSVLNCGGDPMLESNIDAKHFEVLIDRLLSTYPVVLMDLSFASPAVMRTVVARANSTVVVSTPSLPSLRAARTLMSEIADLRGGENDSNTSTTRDDIELLINMRGADNAHEVADKDIPDLMGREIALTMPHMPKIFNRAESRNELIRDQKQGDQVLDALLPLVKRHVHSGERGRGTANSDGGGTFIDKFINWIKQG